MVTAKAIFSKSFPQPPSTLGKTCFSDAERMKRKHREFIAIIKNKVDPYPAPESFQRKTGKHTSSKGSFRKCYQQTKGHNECFTYGLHISSSVARITQYQAEMYHVLAQRGG